MQEYKLIFGETIRNKFFYVALSSLAIFLLLATSQDFKDIVYGIRPMQPYILFSAFILLLLVVFLFLKVAMQLTVSLQIQTEISVGKLFIILAIYSLVCILFKFLLGSLFTGLIGFFVSNPNSDFISMLNAISSDVFSLLQISGAAIALGSRGFTNFTDHYIQLFYNRKTYLYLSILLLLPLIDFLSKFVPFQFDRYIRILIFVFFAIAFFIVFVALTKHWQKIEASNSSS